MFYKGLCFEKGGIQNIEKILQKDSVLTKALNKLKFPFHRIFYFLCFSLENNL
ncbi:hypothetical protein HPSA20_1449 [Helicobacter pylori SouthAfrica20]|uniref:Uncharacterized protein n=1 Tax=Helicobacter pylori SouthAfrica20 TaxID=1352356 RepID=T1UBB5_HELPX|nr:hypothetical protein HPSA20_1449 [Helicobacter pylori SouthAfrica20]